MSCRNCFPTVSRRTACGASSLNNGCGQSAIVGFNTPCCGYSYSGARPSLWNSVQFTDRNNLGAPTAFAHDSVVLNSTAPFATSALHNSVTHARNVVGSAIIDTALVGNGIPSVALQSADACAAASRVAATTCGCGAATTRALGFGAAATGFGTVAGACGCGAARKGLGFGAITSGYGTASKGSGCGLTGCGCGAVRTACSCAGAFTK